MRRTGEGQAQSATELSLFANDLPADDMPEEKKWQ
jgi:hypothetical protein